MFHRFHDPLEKYSLMNQRLIINIYIYINVNVNLNKNNLLICIDLGKGFYIFEK